VPTVTYLASGGKIGDIIRAEVTCDKCTCRRLGERTGSIVLSIDSIPKAPPNLRKKIEGY
jgi:hypothetical protein